MIPAFNDYATNHDAPAATDRLRMTMALGLAQAAAEAGEVPVGAVIFQRGKLLAKGTNQRESLQDPTAHAEIIAITAAAAAVGNWRLDDCELYVTLEPCAMCAGAIILARSPRVIFGAADPKAGAAGSVLSVLNCPPLNHHPEVRRGVLAEECGAVLSEFFRTRRKPPAPE
jgi:tRNA(adenine34) deaminase